MERAIQRSKSDKTAPGVNSKAPSYSDLVTLPENYCVTFDGKPFLRSNIEVENTRLIIFSSPYGLKLLSKADAWSGDGTFARCPPPFGQIYSLLAVCDKKFYPACFAFLPDRKASTYKTFFTEIESMLLEGQGGNGDAGTVNLTKLLVDYEAAVMKEVRSIFGANIEISGCWLHFKRNIWTHLR